MSYCVRSDVENIYGKDNVAQWADLDNDQEDKSINDRIVATIAIADGKINDRLRDGPYTIPFTEPLAADMVTIIDLSARLTGLLLYTNRGTTDQTGANSLMEMQGKKVGETFLKIMGGQIKLPIDTVAVSFPQATHVPLEKPWWKKNPRIPVN